MFFFFFFKQKTAYEMRISDWSSDVCSSDLEATTPEATTGDIIAKPRPKPEGGADDQIAELLEKGPLETADGDKAAPAQAAPKQAAPVQTAKVTAGDVVLQLSSVKSEARSEEHTSELQSLMRISYAVFCLK